MGRNTKHYLSLPTNRLRAKAWSREVKHELLGDRKIKDGPGAHLIDSCLKGVIKSLSEPLRSTLADRVSMRGKYYVSSGRWQDWWTGTKPSPEKIETINLIMPGTSAWFRSAPSARAVENLLYAIDLWCGKEDATSSSLLLLQNINDKWRPRSISESSNRWEMKLGWHIPHISDEPGRHSGIPAEIITDHFRPLEPSSIIESMIWVAHCLDVWAKPCFKNWVFDLVCAAVATKAYIASSGYDMNDFGSSSNDIASLVIDVFIRKNTQLHESRDAMKFIRSRCSFIKDCLPNDANLHDLLMKSEQLFSQELLWHGIEVREIKELNLPNRFRQTSNSNLNSS